jgi:predicted SnoaL-like aldol condensation-catalyzing enzyme
MKTRMMAVVAASLLIGCAAPLEADGGAEAGQGQAQALSNREIVTRFIDLFYRQGRVREAFETYVAEGYIQHNPLAPDGRAAAIAALEPFFASQPNAIREVHRIIVDGDLAAVHVRVRQNPEDRGFAVVDLLRLENGKIVEHWDVIQAVPERSANPHPMF